MEMSVSSEMTFFTTKQQSEICPHLRTGSSAEDRGRIDTSRNLALTIQHFSRGTGPRTIKLLPKINSVERDRQERQEDSTMSSATEAAKKELVECEKEISSIKAAVRMLGPATAATEVESSNSLSVVALKVCLDVSP